MGVWKNLSLYLENGNTWRITICLQFLIRGSASAHAQWFNVYDSICDRVVAIWFRQKYKYSISCANLGARISYSMRLMYWDLIQLTLMLHKCITRRKLKKNNQPRNCSSFNFKWCIRNANWLESNRNYFLQNMKLTCFR